MKVIYMGTPEFAMPALQKLYDNEYDIVYAVTKPDSVSGRGKKIRFSPIKEKALQLGIEVLQPEKLKGNEEFIQILQDASPDLIVVAAYGKILPKALLDIPALGCINIHASLLPRFRGAAPMQAAILAGDEKTGVTIMRMAEGLDTGNMLAKAETPVDKKTAGQLDKELAQIGADLLVRTIPGLALNEGEVQDDSLATYAGMISKKDGLIDFSRSAEEIERMVRAFDPWPGTYTYLSEKMMKIWAAEALDVSCEVKPGTVTDKTKKQIDIACGKGILRVTSIQMPGKRRVAVSEYLKGNSIEIGTVLG